MPARVVEGAEARLGVELGAVGGDPVVALREHDVAGGDDAILVHVEPRRRRRRSSCRLVSSSTLPMKW